LSIGRFGKLANLTSLSLYFHIPFCLKRCRYCDFYSETGAGRSLISHTLDMLLGSLDLALERYEPLCVPSVFIGGGTPSLLPPDLFHTFLGKLHSRIGSPEEFSVEVNPESLSADFLKMLSESDVNRISMGVQTYDAALLNWLGRPAGPEAITRADGLLAEIWKGRLSRDLLAALPSLISVPSSKRSKRDSYAAIRSHRLIEDVRRALADKPGHLSVYELTVEPHTPLAAHAFDLELLPTEKEIFTEWRELVEELRSCGYERYEVSNFARPGNRVLHNLRYWRMEPYLGIGPGAVSTLPHRSGRALRLENSPQLTKWLADPEDAAQGTVLSAAELMLEHFMMALRTVEGLSISQFRSIFATDPVDVAPHSFERWRSAGMLRIDERAIAPTARGLDVLESVLADVAGESDRLDCALECHWPSS